MIFRKPYGFLIKHFRLIHLILTALYIYLAIKVNSLLKYYNDFIAGTERKLNAINLITNYYLIAIIASIIICIIIYALMHYKKKPKLLYLILIIITIAVTAVINMAYSGLDTIYISVLDAKTQRLYRDLLRIILLFQYISIAFTLIRGLGFDIKRFNFKEDLSELGLSEEDSEEVELTLGNTEGILRKIRRRLREFRYYYKENKLFINVVLIIVAVLLLFTLVLDKQVINKVYNENEIVTTDAFKFSALNTYITNRNYNGNFIGTSESSFVIVKISILSNAGEKELNTANIVLKTGNNSYTINQKTANNFTDLGTAYTKQKISYNKNYILIFNVSNNDLNKNMQLQYADDKKINLKPVNIDEITNDKNYKLNENINLEQTILGTGNLTITGIDIKDKFTYNYNYEVNGKTYSSAINITSTNNTIMNLKMNYSLPNKFTIYNFLSTYGKIKYKINNEEYTSNLLNNKTPGSYNEGLYLEVDKNIAQATNIWLELTIRNQKYTYTLK